jgi:hypothetical protein
LTDGALGKIVNSKEIGRDIKALLARNDNVKEKSRNLADR